MSSLFSFRIRLVDWRDDFGWMPCAWNPTAYGHGRSVSWLGVTIWIGFERDRRGRLA